MIDSRYNPDIEYGSRYIRTPNPLNSVSTMATSGTQQAGMASPASPPSGSTPTGPGSLQDAESKVAQAVQQTFSEQFRAVPAGTLDNAINSRLAALGFTQEEINAANTGEQNAEPHGAGFMESNIGGGNTQGFISAWTQNIDAQLAKLSFTPSTDTGGAITTQPVARQVPTDEGNPPKLISVHSTQDGISSSTDTSGNTSTIVSTPTGNLSTSPAGATIPTSTNTQTNISGGDNSVTSVGGASYNNGQYTTAPGSGADILSQLSSGSAGGGVPGSGSIDSAIPTVSGQNTASQSGPASSIAILAIVAAVAILGFYFYKKHKAKAAAQS